MIHYKHNSQDTGRLDMLFPPGHMMPLWALSKLSRGSAARPNSKNAERGMRTV